MSEHELWNELGNLYFMSGSYNQAIHAYTRSIALDRTFGRPYSNMALAYVQKGKYLEAIDLYQRGIKLLLDDQEKAWTWYKLGNLYRQLKDYHRAVDAYERADELDPGYREIERSDNKADALLNRKPTFEDTLEILAESPVVERQMAPTPVSVSVPVMEMKQVVEPVPETPTMPVAQMAEEAVPVVEQKPGIVIMEDDCIPASCDEQELIPLPEELNAWNFDETVVPEDVPWPDFDLWPVDTAGVVGPDENIIFTDPLKWEVQPVRELVQGEAASPSGEAVKETVMASAMVESSENSRNVSAIASSTTGASAPLRQTALQENSAVDTVVMEEKPAPFMFVLSEEDDTTATPDFVAESITNPNAVQYETPDELPVFNIDPAELAAIQIDIEKYKRVLEINPGNAFAWDTIGGLYKTSGRYDEAIFAYRRAISIDSSKSMYFYHLGLVYAAERKLDDAIFAFQKVIEIEPNHSLAHATLGGYYRRMEKEELAKEHIEKAMSSISEDENEYNRACMEAICGNTDRAFELLEIALKNKQTVVEWVRRDPDLDFIRSDPRFNDLLLDYATRPT